MVGWSSPQRLLASTLTPGHMWPPRPASAGDERNRFTGAAAELHGGSGILAANKASVRRNLGPAIGTPGGC